MQVSKFGREFAIARSRSVVKVAMPQRRVNELPITAMRRSGVMSAPRLCAQIAERREELDRQGWVMAHQVFAAGNRSGGLRDTRSTRPIHCFQPRCWFARSQ